MHSSSLGYISLVNIHLPCVAAHSDEESVRGFPLVLWESTDRSTLVTPVQSPVRPIIMV